MPEIKSSENKGSVNLEHIDTSPLDYDESLQFKIELNGNGFQGQATFWVSFDEWNRFLKNLQTLSKMLSGSAILKWGHTEPTSGFIEVRNVDERGHLTVVAKASKQVFGAHHKNDFSVQIQIDIEPEGLNEWVNSLVSLEYPTKE